MKFIRWFLLIVVILVVLSGAGGYLYLRRSLPQISGTLTVAGLEAPIEIIRDVDATPHIYAQSKRDALFGLGYVHAQDRLWQMEFQRRIGQGRLSEILGGATVATDRFLRTLGVNRAARSAWDSLPAADRDATNAYIAGINAYIAANQNKLPPEFLLAGAKPEPWTGPDVLGWQKMMSWDLGGNYSTELLRSDMVRKVGFDRAGQLLAGYPEDGPVIVQSIGSGAGYDQLIELGEQVRALMGVGGPNGEGLGSNNWVIDGTKSATGKPILADDPHLGTRVPSIWYLAHLSAGDFEAIGATLPGAPGVVIGRNRNIAWGVTNLGPDVQDLFRERLDASGAQAEFEGRMEPMQIITETIKVKGAPDIQQRVRITRHGPLISDALNDNDADLPPDDRRESPYEPLAFRWTALDPTDTTLSAFMAINEARNWDDFTAALRNYVAPSQNFVYADVEGNIGYYAPGRLPIRAEGDGALPAEGWSGKNEWTGWIPFEELPHAYNPPEHFIATANNRPTPDDYPYFLGREWAQPYRARRITELLQAKDKLSVDDLAAIQGDIVSLYARQLLPKLLEMTSAQSEDVAQALELLRAWDGTASGDSPAAAIFSAWQLRLPRTLSGDELGDDLINRYEGRVSFTALYVYNTLSDTNSPWCDDVATSDAESCGAVVTQALSEALVDLRARLGDDMQRWRWDQLHVTVFPHQPFDSVAPLRRLFSRSIPNGGDSSTVDVGHFGCTGPTAPPAGRPVANIRFYACPNPYEQRSIPSYRQLIDLSNVDGGRFIQAIGQSGHLLSPHYDDYMADWQAVRYRPMRFERATVEQAQQATLRLEPAP
jgi:penicillin amidase